MPCRSLQRQGGCDNSDTAERRLEAWGCLPPTTGGAKSTEMHIPTGHFSMAPGDLPATDGHNRSIALRFQDGEEPPAAPERVSCTSKGRSKENTFAKRK